MRALRRTKLLATLGPATDDPLVLNALVDAGIDMVRLNLSHGSHDEHRARVEQIRARTQAVGRHIAILLDLQGPKIRIGRFKEGSITLTEEDGFILDTACPLDAGDQKRVGLTFSGLINDIQRGDTLLLADGAIELQVNEVEEREISCRVVAGGKLSDNKGINKKGGGLSAPALTDKDRRDIAFAMEIDADYLAVSFVRSADDGHEARALVREHGGKADIVSKIERAEALEDIDAIIDASDAIMIARGDLGVEIGDAELPAVQKNLITLTRSSNKVVITATQMMESMIMNPIPTRAEVFDVSNSVLDGTDAVMLSAETAAGRYPVKAVRAMDRICREAEKQRQVRRSQHRLDTSFGRIDEAIAMATMYTANHLGVTAITALTESGATPKWMSRISSGLPIYALTPHLTTCRKVKLYRGVYPISFDVTGYDSRKANEEAVEELKRRDVVKEGDLIIITKGDLNSIQGGTNVMKILRVGEHRISEQSRKPSH